MVKVGINGFGIVKVNVADGEISDTYNLGFKVNWCCVRWWQFISIKSAENGGISICGICIG